MIALASAGATCVRKRTRGRRSEVGDRKSEIGSRKSEVRSQKSEVRSQKSEVRGQGFRAFVRLPFVFNFFPLLDFAGMAIDSVTINSRTCFRIATAFGVVDFAENEFKISVRCLFGAVRDAIQCDSLFIDMVTLKRALE